MAKKKTNAGPPTRAELMALSAELLRIADELRGVLRDSRARARAEAARRAEAQRELAATNASVKRARAVAKGLPR